MPRILFATLVLLLLPALTAAQEKPLSKDNPKPYRLPAVDLKQRLIWGSTCETPDGFALSFGGEDQDSDDGIGHTRIKEKGGEWKDIHEELRKANPLQPLHDKVWALRERQKDLCSRMRRLYFQGRPIEEECKIVLDEL